MWEEQWWKLPNVKQSGCPLSYLVSFRFRWVSKSWVLESIGKVENCGRVYLNQVALIIINVGEWR